MSSPKGQGRGCSWSLTPAPNFLQSLEDCYGSGSSGARGWGWGVRRPRWDRGAGTKGRRTAEPSLNKDWVGGGLSLRTPPPAAPAGAETYSEAGRASMAGARTALLPLLLHLGSLALAARGESERPGCAPTSGSTQQTVGPGQTTFPSPPGLRVAGRPWCTLSVFPVGGRAGWGQRGQTGVAELGRVLLWSLPNSPV